MRKKLKNLTDENKVSIHKSKKEPFCEQWKEDILFEFGHITELKNYSYEALIEKSKNDKTALKSYLDLIKVISAETWEKLNTRSRKTTGGFETLPLSSFRKNICDKYNSKMSPDIKLCVFRFGSGDSYRMVGYKSHNCSRTFHVLGFDLDFSLYDHGK